MTTLSDNYNGARQLTWTAVDVYGGGAYSYDHVTDHLLGGGGTGAPAAQYKAEQTCSTSTDQQEVSEDFTLTGSLDYESTCYVFARKHATAGTLTYYSAYYTNNPNDGDGIVYVQKRVAGTESTMIASTHVTRWELGEVHNLKLKVTGTTDTQLDLYVDDVFIDTHTDSSSPITGNLCAAHGTIEMSGDVNWALDNFLAEDVSAGESHTGAALAYIGLQASGSKQGTVALTGAAQIRVAIGARVAGTRLQTPGSSAAAYIGVRASVVGTKVEKTRGARAFLGVSASVVGTKVQGTVITPPEPVHPLLFSPSPLRRFALVDIMTGFFRSLDCPLDRHRFTDTLNRPGGFNAQLPLRSPYATEELLRPWRTAIYVIREDSVEWGGILLPPSMQVGSEALDISAFGWLGYWDHRMIREDYQPVQVDQFAIVQHLIDYAQNESVYGDGYDLDIDVLFHAGLTHGPSGILRDRIDDYRPWKTKNLGEAIRQLAADENGFDYAMTYAINTNTDRVDKTVNLYYPTKGRDTGLTFEYETGKQTNVIARGFADSTTLAWVGDGWGSGTDELRLTSPYVDETARNEYPPYDAAPSWSEVSVQATLDEHTVGEFDRTRQPKRVPVLRLDPNMSPMFGEYAVGDTVRVRIADGYGSTGSVPEVHRITGWTVSEDSVDLVLDKVDA